MKKSQKKLLKRFVLGVFILLKKQFVNGQIENFLIKSPQTY